ncbi:MAG TPA: dolichyl-phosphate beta-glucosyltransferase [Coleofasciculaceae cyanobacterium]|jgi:dolichyl-phosphate beta-glucosyltransferase
METGNPCHLSVVIPACNEELRLSKTLDTLTGYLASQPFSSEIIVVDDGSADGTSQLVQNWANTYPIIRLDGYSQNQGKGNAVRHGIRQARGKAILVLDADGATPIEELERLDEAFRTQPYSIVIGSRSRDTSSTRVKTAFHRKIIGRIFNSLLFLLTPGIQDTQCGFKLFPANIAAELFEKQTLKGFAFDVEILHAALCNRIPVVEVPVNWNNQPGSKVNLITDSSVMFFSLVKIGWNSLLGHYRLDSVLPAHSLRPPVRLVTDTVELEAG